jgi:hypothetical protein
MYALSCVNAFIWSWHVLVAWLCKICGWIASLLIIWGQRLICHHECLTPLLYLVEEHNFLFVAKTFHVPFISLKMKWKMLGNVLPCHMCWIQFALGAKPLHDAYQWEVSYIEVGTWLGGFDMTWGAWGWYALIMFRTLLMRGKFFAKLPESILASSNGCETWWSCSWDRYKAVEYLTCSFGHV